MTHSRSNNETGPFAKNDGEASLDDEIASESNEDVATDKKNDEDYEKIKIKEDRFKIRRKFLKKINSAHKIKLKSFLKKNKSTLTDENKRFINNLITLKADDEIFKIISIQILLEKSKKRILFLKNLLDVIKSEKISSQQETLIPILENYQKKLFKNKITKRYIDHLIKSLKVIDYTDNLHIVHLNLLTLWTIINKNNKFPFKSIKIIEECIINLLSPEKKEIIGILNSYSNSNDIELRVGSDVVFLKKALLTLPLNLSWHAALTIAINNEKETNPNGKFYKTLAQCLVVLTTHTLDDNKKNTPTKPSILASIDEKNHSQLIRSEKREEKYPQASITKDVKDSYKSIYEIMDDTEKVSTVMQSDITIDSKKHVTVISNIDKRIESKKSQLTEPKEEENTEKLISILKNYQNKWFKDKQKKQTINNILRLIENNSNHYNKQELYNYFSNYLWMMHAQMLKKYSNNSYFYYEKVVKSDYIKTLEKCIFELLPPEKKAVIARLETYKNSSSFLTSDRVYDITNLIHILLIKRDLNDSWTKELSDAIKKAIKQDKSLRGGINKNSPYILCLEECIKSLDNEELIIQKVDEIDTEIDKLSIIDIDNDPKKYPYKDLEKLLEDEKRNKNTEKTLEKKIPIKNNIPIEKQPHSEQIKKEKILKLRNELIERRKTLLQPRKILSLPSSGFFARSITLDSEIDSFINHEIKLARAEADLLFRRNAALLQEFKTSELDPFKVTFFIDEKSIKNLEPTVDNYVLFLKDDKQTWELRKYPRLENKGEEEKKSEIKYQTLVSSITAQELLEKKLKVDEIIENDPPVIRKDTAYAKEIITKMYIVPIHQPVFFKMQSINNILQNKVIDQILSENNLTIRAIILERWIMVGKIAFEQKNYPAVSAIFTAINLIINKQKYKNISELISQGAKIELNEINEFLSFIKKDERKPSDDRMQKIYHTEENQTVVFIIPDIIDFVSKNQQSVSKQQNIKDEYKKDADFIHRCQASLPKIALEDTDTLKKRINAFQPIRQDDGSMRDKRIRIINSASCNTDNIKQQPKAFLLKLKNTLWNTFLQLFSPSSKEEKKNTIRPR